MKKIIFDCDNTVGIPGYPMDDALALLYVLGNSDKAEILGLTCTFGNGTADQVYGSTRLLLDEVQASGKFHLLRGAEKGEDPKSESARFIVEMANRYPGEVIFLGIGSVTNLYGAWLLDPELFEKLGQTVLMGGITEPLYTHGKHCPELNFSINKEATAAVLSKGKNISIITGNNCLGISYLPKEEFFERMRVESDPIGAYVAKKCGYRFDAREAVYGERGSYCWDVVAAAYAIDPELFDDDMTRCAISEESLRDGSLIPSPCGNALLNLPRARDAEAFRMNIYAGWQALNFEV